MLFVLALPALLVAQDEDPMNPNWGAFHTTERAYAWLEGWATAFPELTKLYSIGETLRGTQLTIGTASRANRRPSSSLPLAPEPTTA